MSDILTLVALVVVYALFMRFVLPAMGVPT